MDFKNIHIGQLIEKRAKELEIDSDRICKFLKCSHAEITETYSSVGIDSHKLLRWSKLLEYDFFRIYSQHILLFSSKQKDIKSTINKKTSLPEFRKNIYTKEIIDFILLLINSGKMSKQEVINTYNIPKTTLYKWLNKYNNADYETNR